MYDIHIFTYNLTAGKEESGLPGLYAAVPPRRPARGRENDLLIMLLHLEGNSSLPADTQQEMLEKLSTAYYKTQGAVTHALKVIAEQMNERLMARNVRQQREGGPILGIFSAAVLHGSTIFVAHAGPAHSFVLTRETVQEFQDDFGARSLGASKAVSVRYYRCEVEPGDLALLSPSAPSGWNAKNLAGSPQLSLDQMRRRLLIQTGRDLRFIMLRFRQGKGEIRTVPLRPEELLPATVQEPPMPPAEVAPAKEAASPSRGAIAPEPFPVHPSETEPAKPANGIFLSGETLPAEEGSAELVSEKPPELYKELFKHTQPVAPEPAALTRPSPPAEEPPDFPPHLETEDIETASLPGLPEDEVRRAESAPATARPTTEASLRRRQAERRARRVVGGAIRGGRSFKEKTAAFISRFLPRVLPGQAEKLPALSPAVLIFIAVAVPLVIVTAATTFYIRNGRSEQHSAYLAQAQAMFDQGNAQSDMTLKRVNLQASLEWIDRAETYGVSEGSIALREKVQAGIDTIDGIRRFDLQLALPGGFDAAVNITRIVTARAEDLFLLDGASGRVFRLVYTRPGYDVDTEFVCGPGMVGSLIIGPLIDIAAAPVGNNFDAAVVGLDAAGNLLYCSTTPANTMAITLAPPDAGWGKIKSIYVDSASMLVLDSGANAVWRYEGFNLEYPNAPRLFFDNDVPDLSAAIDLIQNRDELFVLNQDGHMLECTYSNVSTTPTRCKNPYPYQVTLPGQSQQDVVTFNATFARMQLTQPPEPSIYILDTSGPGVYQFSLALNFYAHLEPDPNGTQLPQTPVSAFAVTSARNLILVFGNQVYLSPLPAP